MFCPDCGSEYRPGFSRCVDCELDLVDELSPAPEPEEPLTLATVYATGDRALLARAKSLLDSAGIPYLTQGEDQHDLLDQGRLGPGARAEPMAIQVGAGSWRQAGAILRSADLEPVEATPEEQGAGEEWEEEREDEAGDWPQPVPRALPEDRLRAWELALVLFVGFASPLLYSTWHWWTGTEELRTAYGLVHAMLMQVGGLVLVAYVLSRRGQSFRDLGLTFRWSDLPAAGLLTMAAFLAQGVAAIAMRRLGLGTTGHRLALAGPESPTAILTLSLLYVVIDPIHEEMIARAFTMTEVEALTGSARLAILASVVLQTSYHFYYGTVGALTTAAMFLVYACFYARFRRITPVILSHICWDVVLTLRGG